MKDFPCVPQGTAIIAPFSLTVEPPLKWGEVPTVFIVGRLQESTVAMTKDGARACKRGELVGVRYKAKDSCPVCRGPIWSVEAARLTCERYCSRKGVPYT